MKKIILTIGLTFLTFGAFASNELLNVKTINLDGDPPRKVHHCINDSFGPGQAIKDKFDKAGYAMGSNQAYMIAFKNCLKKDKRS